MDELIRPDVHEIKVGPLGNSYRYRIGDKLSAERYCNAQSAWHDARLTQRVTENGRLEPAIWQSQRVRATGDAYYGDGDYAKAHEYYEQARELERDLLSLSA